MCAAILCLDSRDEEDRFHDRSAGRGWALLAGTPRRPHAFYAGQIPLDPKSGQIVSQDVGEQTRRVLDNLTAVLKAEQLDFSNS